MTDEEYARAVYEREKVKETLATEGAAIIAQKLMKLVEDSKHKQLVVNPFKNPEQIIRAQQLRGLVEDLSEILQNIVNFEGEKKWSIWTWVNRALGK